jgi:hypothetical protein
MGTEDVQKAFGLPSLNDSLAWNCVATEHQYVGGFVIADVVHRSNTPMDECDAGAGLEIPGYAAIHWLKCAFPTRCHTRELHNALDRHFEERVGRVPCANLGGFSEEYRRVCSRYRSRVLRLWNGS